MNAHGLFELCPMKIKLSTGKHTRNSLSAFLSNLSSLFSSLLSFCLLFLFLPFLYFCVYLFFYSLSLFILLLVLFPIYKRSQIHYARANGRQTIPSLFSLSQAYRPSPNPLFTHRSKTVCVGQRALFTLKNCALS